MVWATTTLLCMLTPKRYLILKNKTELEHLRDKAVLSRPVVPQKAQRAMFYTVAYVSVTRCYGVAVLRSSRQRIGYPPRFAHTRTHGNKKAHPESKKGRRSSTAA